MQTRTYTTTVEGVGIEKLWRVWSNVDAWHTWQDDLEFAKLEGAFAAGSTFLLKPKGGPKVRIELLTVEPNARFKDLTRFPLARMYGDHVFVQKGDKVEITTTMSIEGLLAFPWRKIVMDDIVAGLEDQTRSLVERARADV